MDASELRLKDKTVLLAGPLTRWAQSLTQKLTQSGSNVIFFHDEVNMANRFANQISESREINERFGRAAAVEVDFKSEKAIRDAVSRAAEFYGGIDIFLDAQFTSQNKVFLDFKSADEVSTSLTSNLNKTFSTLQAVLPFLVGRKKGRIVFLVPQSWSKIGQLSLLQAARGGLVSFSAALTKEVSGSLCTVNCVDIGLTEELLLTLCPGKTMMKALEELREKHPGIAVTDPDRVADGLIFFLSGLSQGASGQLLCLN